MLRLASLLLFLSILNESINQSIAAVDFTLVNGMAPWAARANTFLTRAPTSFTYQRNGQSINAPANSFLIYGGDWSSNDVWLSTNKGTTWSQISGNNTDFATFMPTYGATSLTATIPEGRHYRIAGERTAGGQCVSSVYHSTNGQSWTMSTGHQWTPRMWPSSVVDSTGAVYIIGGRSCGASSETLNDVWRSTDQGATWNQQAANVPFGGPRNSVAGSAHNEVLRQDIFYHWSGWNGNRDFNDVFTSSDKGVTWQAVTRNAPWQQRDDATGFVTSNGVLVLVGGKSVGNPEIFHNDIWVSLNGGYHWGKCIEDAAFSDRRYSTATLDEAGFLYVAAGESNEGGSRLLNDVWKSTISFTDTGDLVRECGVSMPVCQKAGMSCYPGQAGTVVTSTGVTCPACGTVDPDMLNFEQMTDRAPWSARAFANMETMSRPLTYNAVGTNAEVKVPKGALVMQGSGKQDENDVWISTTKGVKWDLIAGISRYGVGGFTRAGGNHDTTSFSTNPFAVSFAFDEKANYVYRVGGEITSGAGRDTCANTVVSSFDAIKWNQVNRGSAPFVTPLRRYAATVVDSTGALYVTGGRECGKGEGLQDVWMSQNKGSTWTLQTAKAQWPARLVHMMLHAKTTKALQTQDVMWVLGGWTGSLDFNDVWASMDSGKTWLVLTLGANWQRRDDFNAEITKDGLLIVSGGKQANADGTDREYFNDVWVSADGGYTWKECVKDAAFADRRYQMTVLDDAGHLLVAGGQLVERGQETLFNDVWRSSFSFTDLKKVEKACGIKIPSCGLGLSCLPTSPGFKRLPGTCGVTCNACPATCNTGVFDFVRQCGTAPWSARSGGNMEQIEKSITFTAVTGENVVVPAGALILHGERDKAENDVWLSSDKGFTWKLIAGISRKGRSGVVRAGGGHDVTSFFPASSPAFTLDSKHNIYRINGQNTSNECLDAVWSSSNGGVTWTNQYLHTTSKKHITPSREHGAAIWDVNGNIFVTGGRNCADSAPLNDVWRSSDLGRNWQLMTAKAPWASRLVHQLLAIPSTSTRLEKDLLVMMSGWLGNEDVNDVWASSDSGKSWSILTKNAAWASRDDANAEVTAKGLIVFTSGKTEVPYEVHNDVWVSADGGYTFGLCKRDAAFSDRRYQMTIFDNEDYLYVAAGDSADDQQLNDVWRSSLPFSDAKMLMSVCGIRVPQCGIGLHCWPTSPGFKILDQNRGATCNLCQSEPDPDDESSSSSSTGANSGTSSEPISSTMLVVIFVALAAVVIVALCFARNWRNSQTQAREAQFMTKNSQTEMSTNLLAANHVSSSV